MSQRRCISTDEWRAFVCENVCRQKGGKHEWNKMGNCVALWVGGGCRGGGLDQKRRPRYNMSNFLEHLGTRCKE